MSAPTTDAVDLRRRLQAVPRPTPVLSREREQNLTQRQRELLQELCGLFDHGFANLTMAKIARHLRCSLRTLYELAPSRDELVLIVVDLNLWRIGRTAAAAIDFDAAPLDALRTYLRAANVALASSTPEFSRDMASLPAALAMSEAHSDYIIAVARCLLDIAVERGDIHPVDTAAVARVMAGAGRDFSRPEVLGTLQKRAREAADEVVDLVLHGLAAPPSRSGARVSDLGTKSSR